MSSTKFEDLEWRPHPNMDGRQALTFFSNGFGASVVSGNFSYGGESGLYELAVLEGTPGSWSLTYKTPITDDVLGHLSEADVARVLNQIAALPHPKAAVQPPATQ